MLNFAKTRPCYHLLIKQIVTVFILLAVTGSIIFACENSSTKTETLSVDLLTAIEKENIALITQHIDTGTNINDYPIPKGLPFEGAQPLTLAVLKGNAEIVKLLLDNGADIEIKAKNKDKATPLHWAAFFQQEDMVSLLIKFGANVNSLDANGLTPLDSATYVKLTVMNDARKLEKTMRIIEILIKNGGKSASEL